MRVTVTAGWVSKQDIAPSELPHVLRTLTFRTGGQLFGPHDMATPSWFWDLCHLFLCDIRSVVKVAQKGWWQ